MKRPGFVFTLDAILALLLVTMFVVSISQINTSAQVYSTYMRSQSKYIAEDTLTMFRTVSLRDLVPPEKLEEWISDGTLNTTLVTPDMSPIDIVATYWATAPIFPGANLKHKAEVIMGYVLNNTLTDYNYELMINNYTSPYLRKVGANYSKAPDVSPATLILSGYAYNRTPRGYMARAFLTKATHENSELIGVHRVLTGTCLNSRDDNTFEANVTFRLPEDATILSGDANFVPRSWSNEMEAYINGNGPLDEGYHSDVSSYYKAGLNWVYFEVVPYSNRWGSVCRWYRYWTSLEEGFGSGTTMLINYRADSFFTEDPNTINLYDVTSYAGIVYFLTVVPTGSVRGITIHLETENVNMVRLYYSFGSSVCDMNLPRIPNNGIVDYSSAEIEAGLGACGLSYSDLGNHSFTLILAFDAYYSPGIDVGRDWYYSGLDDGNIAERHIIGNGASWVKLDVVSKIIRTRYSIPLSIPLDYDDFQYSNLKFSSTCYAYGDIFTSYTLPSSAEPWYADYWIGIYFRDAPSGGMKFWENDETNGIIYNDRVDIYMYRFGYPALNEYVMVPGQENEFHGMSYDPDYGFRFCGNEGETRGIIKYFIEGHAGYGDVFPLLSQGYPQYKGYNLTYYYSDGSGTYQRTILIGNLPYKKISVDNLDPTKYAIDDAILRLFNNLNYLNDINPDDWRTPPYDGSQLNPIDIDLPVSVRIEAGGMGNIPDLFRPITITLRVWRED